MADTLCAISFIVILFLSIYALVKHQNNKEDKSRLFNLERFVREILVPDMHKIQRRLDYLESQVSKNQIQEPLVTEPAKEPFHHYVHKPYNEEVPISSYVQKPPELSMPIRQEAPPTQPYSQDKETISMEVEFGSKWLQYIGLAIVIITLLLLGAYAIRYITPLQENTLMYLCSIALLIFGEYLYRVKDSRSYGLGLVFGGLIALYISCASSHYVYEFIEFHIFILFVIIAALINIILGFRYYSNLMVFKGITITFIIISIVKLENFVTPLEYSILLPIVTAIGSIVIFLRKNLEMLLFFMILSYVWVIISALHFDKFILIPFFSAIAIIMMLIMLLQKDKERLSAFVLFGLDAKLIVPLEI